MAKCARCGYEIAKDHRFCPGCGEAVVRRTGAELRQLSVLFCDIVDSVTLVARLGPEDFYELQQEYHDTCSRVVRKFGGFVAELLGDGVVAYFGYPATHEDDPSRAIQTGLRILEITKQRKGLFHNLELRAGVDTGVTHVGQLRFAEGPAIRASGAVLSKASRIQAEAEPGTIVVSDSTYHIAKHHFHFEPIEPRLLRGFREPERLHVVRGPKVEDWDLTPALSKVTPLMGRSHEMELLRRSWVLAQSGTPQIVHISADPGYGKSRLAQELKQESRCCSPAISEFRCSDYHRNASFHPIAENLSRRIGLRGNEAESQILEVLEQWLRERGKYSPDTLSRIASIFNIAAAASEEITPQRQRRALLDSVCNLLLRPADHRPQLIVFEDLHWADPSTIELLNTFITTGLSGPQMIILTYRPEFIPPWPQSDADTRLELNAIDRHASAEMVQALAGDRALAAGDVFEIVAHTEGVPLYIEEVTRARLEPQAARDWHAIAEEKKLEKIPPKVVVSLMGRIDRLAESKKILHVAAILGREFSLALLQQVSDSTTPEVEQALEAACRARLIYKEGEGKGARYYFKHALIQAVAHCSVLRKSRRFYHARAADALRQNGAEPALLALHYDEAGIPAEAIQCWIVAGKDALRRAANREAHTQFHCALDSLKSLPDTPERSATELDTQLALMAASMALFGWASKQVEACCVRAHQLSLELGDAQTRLGALWGMWTVQFLRSELGQAMPVAQQVFELALTPDLAMFEPLARHAAGFTEYCFGHFLHSLEHGLQGERALNIEVERKLVAAYQFSPSTANLSFLSHSAWLVGNDEVAVRAAREVEALVAELRHPPCFAFYLGFNVYVHHSRQDITRVRSFAGQLFNIAEAEGYEAWKPVAEIFLGWLAAHDGEESGVSRCRKGIEAAAGTRNLYTHDKLLEAEALVFCGRDEEALRAIDEGLDWWRAKDLVLMVPELMRLRGSILQRTGRQEEAEHAFRDAIELATLCGAVRLRQRAEHSMLELFSSTRTERLSEPATSDQPPVAQFSVRTAVT
ncbi:MAG: AAA family ATPase [Bryobacteraceae bacterium]